MSNSTITEIIEKYSVGPLTAAEAIILDKWLQSITPEEFHRTLDQCETLPAGLKEAHPVSERFIHALERRIDEADAPVRIRTIPWKKWTAIAASLIFLLTAGALLWTNNHRTNNDTTQIPAKDLNPGVTGAILTLANGKQIVLDTAHNGSLTLQGNTILKKLNDGRLAYEAAEGNSTGIFFNTLTTPRGRKISTILADGTEVWLNAASSIRYPTAFSGKDRVVEISGEAFFEVAKDAAHPFIVKKMGSDYSVLVLGTGFNINAYDDEEAISTTLLSGSVKILGGGGSNLLNPGQQAIVKKGNNQIVTLTDVNTEQVTAWKNDKFIFDHADIQTVMRQIARWYDVDIEYKGNITKHFGGTISRDVNVSKVFQMLASTGAVQFNIEGRKIEVIP